MAWYGQEPLKSLATLGIKAVTVSLQLSAPVTGILVKILVVPGKEIIFRTLYSSSLQILNRFMFWYSQEPSISIKMLSEAVCSVLLQFLGYVRKICGCVERTLSQGLSVVVSSRFWKDWCSVAVRSRPNPLCLQLDTVFFYWNVCCHSELSFRIGGFEGASRICAEFFFYCSPLLVVK